MSRRRPKKSDLDDLDDVLDDLLADDDDPPKKSTGGRTGRGGAKSVTLDDDFYRSLAANAPEVSDVSDADPNEMAQGLDDLDDMDAALFSPKKGAGQSKETAAKPVARTTGDEVIRKPDKHPIAEVAASLSQPDGKNTSASALTTNKTLPTSQTVSSETKESTKSPAKAGGKSKAFDLDDYDDPLADLLSDDDDIKPKKSVIRKATPEKPPLTPETELTARSSKKSPRAKGRRLEINRPPTRSGNKDAAGGDKPKKADDNMFDDDDVLGGLGFDDSPPVKPSSKAKTAVDGPGKGLAIMDDLLGGSGVTKHLERPGSGSDRPREFVLDKRYQKTESKPKELTEDDFNFGTYLPSAAATPGSRPSSRRSVRFEDDDEVEKPPSQGGGARRGRGTASSFLEDMINKDDRDWLDIASEGIGGPKSKAKGDDRPKSEGSNREKPLPEKPSTAQSEPVDWLGLSRLGSPESPRPPRLGQDDFTNHKEPEPTLPEPKPRSGGRGGIPKETSDPDDWLGVGGSPTKHSTPKQKRSNQLSSDQPDDWLGIGRSSPIKDNVSDWLEGKDSKEELPDDWLGVTKDTSALKSGTNDDWLGETKNSSVVKSGKNDDWFGSSSGPGAEKGDVAASGDYTELSVELEDPFSKSLSKSRADERGLDLFSPPPKETTTLPWETERGSSPVRGRRGRGRTPPQAAKQENDEVDHGEENKAVFKTKREIPPPLDLNSGPVKPLSPRGTSPADSPRDLMATLDALKKMDQQKREEPAPLSAVVPAAAPLPLFTPMPGPSGGVGATADLLQQQQQQMVAAQKLQMKQQEDLLRKQQKHILGQQQQQQEEFEKQLAAQQARLAMQQEHRAKQQMAQMTQAMLQPAMSMRNPVVDLQQQLIEQQERMRQQQQQQMTQMMEAQQLMMQQQMSQVPQMSSLGLGGVGMLPGLGMGSIVMDDLRSQVKRLELEKLHLESLRETSKHQHQEELKLLEDSYNKRTEMLEESYQKRETRLKEENELVTSQSMTKLRMVEQEKSDIVASYIRRLEEVQQTQAIEVERLKEQHRKEIGDLRKQHEESLERVWQAKDREITIIASQHDTTRNLHDVMEHMASNARNLEHLQTKVDLKHNLSLDERETAARSRDEQLTTLQNRLERQQHENELERAQLQGLLTTMETQLTEQTRSMEEEKWRVRQEEGRLQAAQDAIKQEKTMMMDQLRREREAVQRSKDQLLDEQKSILAQLYEERKALASERAKFEMNQKLNTEQAQRDNMKNIKTGAELESSVQVITEEKVRLAKQVDDLRMERDKFAKDRSNVEQEQQTLQIEKEKLETIALQVRQRSKDIEEMCLVSAQVREVGETAMSEGRRLEADQAQRMAAIQAQLQTLRNKERQIAQERLSLAKEKQTLEQKVGSMLCVNCSTPVRDGTTRHPTGAPPSMQGTRKITPAAANLLSALDPDLRAKVESMSSVSAEIAMDRSIRLWRIAADKDKEFLNEETFFLQAIKHMPYGDADSQQGS